MTPELLDLSKKPYIKHVSKLLLGLFVLSHIFGLLCFILYELQWLGFVPSFTLDYKAFLEYSVIASVTGSILSLVLLYKIWAIIQVGEVRAKPGSAVLRLFIPIYNIYWLFQAYCGWAEDYNKTLSQHKLEEPHMPEIFGLLASIALLLGVFAFGNAFVRELQVSQRALYVIRQDRSVPILHERQLEQGEQVYEIRGGKLWPVKAKPDPEVYSFYIHTTICNFGAGICLSILLIMFYWRASFCANSLYEKLDLEFR